MNSLIWINVDNKKAILDSFRLSQSILVKGGPGTGKTYIGVRLTERIYDFLKPWQRILFLTFSKFAKVQIVNEKQKQLEKGEIRREAAIRLDVFNFHSLWWEWIGNYSGYLETSMRPRLILESQRRKELEAMIVEHLPSIPDNFKTAAGKIRKKGGKRENLEFNKSDLIFMMFNSLSITRFGINFLPNGLRPIAAMDNFNNFLSKCSERLREDNRNGQFWHDETAYYAAILLKGHPNFATWVQEVYPVVIVDEFHDTDLAQWSVIRLMRPTTLVGLFDPDQMIYPWRGASADERIASFVKEFSPKCFQLICRENNPRSGKRIFGDLGSEDMKFKPITQSSDPTRQINIAAIQLRFKLINLLKDDPHADVAILCRTNDEADFFFERLKRKYHNSRPFTNVRRLGSEYAPFSNIRELMHCIALDDGVDPIRHLLRFLFRFFLLDNGCKKGRKDSPDFYFDRNSYRQAWKKGIILLSQHLGKLRRKEGVLSTLVTLPELIDEFLRTHIDVKGYIEGDVHSCLRFVGGRLNKVDSASKEANQVIEAIDEQIVAFENYYLNNPKPGISVMTAHQSKGREYQHVIIAWCAQYPFTVRSGLFGWSKDDDDLQYVARTRAKETATIFYPEDNPSELIKPYLTSTSTAKSKLLTKKSMTLSKTSKGIPKKGRNYKTTSRE